MNSSSNTSEMPVISCSAYVIFANNGDADGFQRRLADYGIVSASFVCKSSNEIMIRIAHVEKDRSWEFINSINSMFSSIRFHITDIKELAYKHRGKWFIDIECHRGGVYPAMLFEGEAMKCIHYLEADISIDMYDDLCVHSRRSNVLL